MNRLLLHVEGRTEVLFVNEVLAPYLYNRGYMSVSARLMGSANSGRQRGGVRSWESARREIINNLVGDSELIVSTMVDYYGMPNNWPGRAGASTDLLASGRAKTIEGALLEDVRCLMDSSFNSNRFIPYVMMHEFEAMLFSDCETLGNAIGRSDLTGSIQSILDEFGSPEEIDDSPATAPSKRIQALSPEYQKPTMGLQAAQAIGLEAIREECPHFHEWLERLESLAQK